MYGHGKLSVSVFSGEDSFQSSMRKILLGLIVSGYSHTACEWIKCWIHKRVTHILNVLRFCVEMRISLSCGPGALASCCFQEHAVSPSLVRDSSLLSMKNIYMILCRSCIISGLPPCSSVFWTLKRFHVILAQCSSEMILLLFCPNHHKVPNRKDTKWIIPQSLSFI